MTSCEPREYSDDVEALRVELPELAAEIASFQGVEAVLAWMEKRSLHRGAIDLVAQDEFESDFLIELEPGGRWLVFGVT